MKTLTPLRKFACDDNGAALVEFGMLLPIMILFLGLCVEGGRTFWSYQSTITGVRDAARYLSRVAPQTTCEDGDDLQGWNAKLTEIVRDTQSGESLFPTAVSVTSVRAALDCVAGNYRNGDAPVATITATLHIGYPFAGMFALAGFDVKPVTTIIRDTARIVGT